MMTISPNALLIIAVLALLPLVAMVIAVTCIERRQQKRLLKQIASGKEMLLLAEAVRIAEQHQITAPESEAHK